MRRKPGSACPTATTICATPSRRRRAKYRDYVAQMLDMVGWPAAQARADAIVALETRIAEASWTRAESRDRDKTYNPMTKAELAASAPGFAWSA